MQSERIFFGGAPLSPEVGNKLSQRVALHSAIGFSEAGVIGSLRPTHRECWEYSEWNPNNGIHMVSIDDGVFEAVIRKGKNHDLLGIFHTCPDIRSIERKTFLRSIQPSPGSGDITAGLMMMSLCSVTVRSSTPSIWKRSWRGTIWFRKL
jgi:hypothetical protein